MEQRVSVVTLGVGDKEKSRAHNVASPPDGHSWEICHNPHWTLTPDGETRLGA